LLRLPKRQPELAFQDRPLPFEIYLNVAAAGVLTGLVYGLMALGLSVIFGVIRVVNFAHGEMMAIAMYIAVTLFAAFKLDPRLKNDPEVIAAAVKGFLTTPGYDGRLASLVLDLGHAAAPLLEDAAQTYRAPGMRPRAAAIAKRLS